jgi:hypothetical protein
VARVSLAACTCDLMVLLFQTQCLPWPFPFMGMIASGRILSIDGRVLITRICFLLGFFLVFFAWCSHSHMSGSRILRIFRCVAFGCGCVIHVLVLGGGFLLLFSSSGILMSDPAFVGCRSLVVVAICAREGLYKFLCGWI